MKCTPAHLAAMKRWRERNKDYMKSYYATHPVQWKKHKAMSKRAYWKLRLNPRKWKAFLDKVRPYHRAWLEKRRAEQSQ